MRIAGFKVKCNRFILISDRVCGDCLLEKEVERKGERSCNLDETCRMPERVRNFVSRNTSS
jgi:hypothetical protein